MKQAGRLSSKGQPITPTPCVAGTHGDLADRAQVKPRDCTILPFFLESVYPRDLISIFTSVMCKDEFGRSTNE